MFELSNLFFATLLYLYLKNTSEITKEWKLFDQNIGKSNFMNSDGNWVLPSIILNKYNNYKKLSAIFVIFLVVNIILNFNYWYTLTILALFHHYGYDKFFTMSESFYDICGVYVAIIWENLKKNLPVLCNTTLIYNQLIDIWNKIVNIFQVQNVNDKNDKMDNVNDNGGWSKILNFMNLSKAKILGVGDMVENSSPIVQKIKLYLFPVDQNPQEQDVKKDQ